MSTLFIVQFACCIVSTMMMTILACSGILIRWHRRRYEVSRWLLCTSMFLLATHFILQMKHGFRAMGDDVGAVVNILFYAPAAFLIAYAIYNVECARSGRKLFAVCGVVIYALILIAFFIGHARTGSMHIGDMLYVMQALFGIGLIAAVVAVARIVFIRRRDVERDTGMDLVVYDRFAVTSIMVFNASALMLIGAIVYRPMLFVVGPILLISLFAFVLCFIALGYNVKTIAEVAEMADVIEEKDVLDENTFTEERIAEIEAALEGWCQSGGYRDNMVSVITVADAICVPRRELSLYFKTCARSTFRAWLSDVRFETAKRLLRKNKNYSIDAISTECGFVSHTQLYRLFKANTGMSPGQWRESREDTQSFFSE